MSQKRNMPTKKAIIEYWADNYEMELYDEICWACSFPSVLYRCHLLAKCKGGNENVENLILLCSFCHNIQEHYFSDSIETAKIFKNKIIESAPFLNIRYYYFESLIKHGIINTNKWQKQIEQAKEMEKQQKMQSYEEGYMRVAKLIEDATQRNLKL